MIKFNPSKPFTKEGIEKMLKTDRRWILMIDDTPKRIFSWNEIIKFIKWFRGKHPLKGERICFANPLTGIVIDISEAMLLNSIM